MKIEYAGREPLTIYDNPIPHLRSRHGYFPNVVLLPSGELIAAFVLGEAFDAANCTTWITRSKDCGQSWTPQGPVYDKNRLGYLTSDSMKLTPLRDGTLIAAGYRFHRPDPESPICDPATGGLLSGDNIIAWSRDEGVSWSEPAVMPRSRPELIELSGPCIETSDGDLLACGALLPLPDGSNPSGRMGVLLRSSDGGRTWDDSTAYFRSDRVVPYESRLVEMDGGKLAVILWAWDAASGQHLPNLVTVSSDHGCSWSEPVNTGISAQSSCLAHVEGDLLLAAHCHRDETEPGLWVRLVEFRGRQWRVLAEIQVYGRGKDARTSNGRIAAEMFRSLRFGQPSLLRLSSAEWLVAHWCIEDGQGRILGHRIALTL